MAELNSSKCTYIAIYIATQQSVKSLQQLASYLLKWYCLQHNNIIWINIIINQYIAIIAIYVRNYSFLVIVVEA